MNALTRPLALALLLGTLLLAGGAALHPILHGDGSMELGMIGSMAIWRTMHLCMLGGTGLIVVGNMGASRRHAIEQPNHQHRDRGAHHHHRRHRARLAQHDVHGRPRVAHGRALAAGDTTVTHQFELMHSVGLMSARFGNYLIALGALLLGAAEWMTAGRPRWLAVLAWIAAAGGLVGVIFFDEATPEMLGAVSLLCGWQVGAAIVALQKPRPLN